MKKSGLAILAASLIAATTVFAANTEEGYFSTQSPLVSAHGGNDKAARFPATDITIINASNSVIYVMVPNTPIYDTLAPFAQPDHVRNTRGAFYTTIELQDPGKATFFKRSFCPRALVTVYGHPGSYDVNVDDEFCN